MQFNEVMNLTGNRESVALQGNTFLVKPDGTVAIAKKSRVKGYSLFGVDVDAWKAEGASGLPEPIKGVLFLVPNSVRAACPDRKDIATAECDGTLVFNP